MLGTCQLVPILENDTLFVANCYTQVFYGYNGRFASPKGIEWSIWRAYEYADYHHLALFLPKIGAGRGGLDWEKEVLPIIKNADSSWSRVSTNICIWGE